MPNPIENGQYFRCSQSAFLYLHATVFLRWPISRGLTFICLFSKDISRVCEFLSTMTSALLLVGLHRATSLVELLLNSLMSFFWLALWLHGWCSLHTSRLSVQIPIPVWRFSPRPCGFPPPRLDESASRRCLSCLTAHVLPVRGCASWRVNGGHGWPQNSHAAVSQKKKRHPESEAIIAHHTEIRPRLVLDLKSLPIVLICHDTANKQRNLSHAEVKEPSDAKHSF